MTKDLVHIDESKILNAIARGVTETQITDLLGINMGEFISYLAVNKDFAVQVEKARNVRAEKWHSSIVSLVLSPEGNPIIHDKDDVPGAKLAVDTFKWLAKIDNREKYGDKIEVDSTITNVLEIKGLSPQEAMNIIRQDPFAPPIDAEYTTIDEQEVTSYERKIDDDQDML